MLKKIAIVFGTRPEAIKLAPVIKVLGERKELFETLIISTGQHKEMLRQVLEIFDLEPHIDLHVMKENQNLIDVTSTIIQNLNIAFKEQKPDFVVVQGDTTTTFAAALTAFYNRIPVGHVEAGLRTYNKFSPFPEEINRQLTTVLSDLHFAPTLMAHENLIHCGVHRDKIVLTGNTVIDALHYYLSINEKNSNCHDETGCMRRILVTAHRRENFGEPIRNICLAIRDIVQMRNDIEFIYPVHLNPNIQAPVHELLGGLGRVSLIPSQTYFEFLRLMRSSYLILSDSGGVQEEAPSLGKPVLVLRDTSERMEAVEAGAVKLVGTDRHSIVQETLTLLDDSKAYASMANAGNPFGDGFASSRIADAIAHYFGMGPYPVEFQFQRGSKNAG